MLIDICPLMGSTKWPADKWIDKRYYRYTGTIIHLLEEVHIFATTWMDLEDIRLSEISQLQKDKYCMIPFIYRSHNNLIS